MLKMQLTVTWSPLLLGHGSQERVQQLRLRRAFCDTKPCESDIPTVVEQGTRRHNAGRQSCNSIHSNYPLAKCLAASSGPCLSQDYVDTTVSSWWRCKLLALARPCCCIVCGVQLPASRPRTP
jgi:hypothetical protein